MYVYVRVCAKDKCVHAYYRYIPKLRTCWGAGPGGVHATRVCCQTICPARASCRVCVCSRCGEYTVWSCVCLSIIIIYYICTEEPSIVVAVVVVVVVVADVFYACARVCCSRSIRICRQIFCSAPTVGRLPEHPDFQLYLMGHTICPRGAVKEDGKKIIFIYLPTYTVVSTL